MKKKRRRKNKKKKKKKKGGEKEEVEKKDDIDNTLKDIDEDSNKDWSNLNWEGLHLFGMVFKPEKKGCKVFSFAQ